MAQSNTAYDLSLFEQKKKSTVVKLEPPKKAPKPKHNRLAAMKTLMIAALVVGVLGVMLFSRAQLTELTTNAAAAQKELTAAESEYQRLQLQMDAGVKLKKIEEIAQRDLGLVKSSDYQLNYVTLTSGNEVEVTEKDGSLIGQLVRFIGSLFSGK